ncbi:hypothetical protein [Reinekea blandensis]|nr:hypothetical protein [Reinekea blandensis]
MPNQLNLQQPHTWHTIVGMAVALSIVAWLISAILQLKPDMGHTQTRVEADTPIAWSPSPSIQTAPASIQLAPSPSTALPPTALDPVADTLNALLHDYFTTSFDIETQARWRYRLSAGSPYLAELAAYLKLDRLYDMNLYPSASRQITEQYRAESLLDDTRSSLFDVLNHHADQFWPMSLIAGSADNTYRESLLLNHYDRDFLIKIERGGLADTLAPLAPGIQRLLEFHLNDVVMKSAGLRISRRTHSIDKTVQAMTPYAGAGSDVFRFYNAVLKQEWDQATALLMKAPGLQSERYDFLYDLLATSAPEALLRQITLPQYQRRYGWWNQFFYFQACLNRKPHWLEVLNRNLSIQLSCEGRSQESVPDIVTLSDDLIANFWEQILSAPTITDSQLDSFFGSLNTTERTEIAAINSHTVLDFLARKGRIRIIRNANLYQRIEVNYQHWQRRYGTTHGDSFYQYSPLLHWFSSRRFNDVQLHQELIRLLPTFSQPIQDSMADQLLDHLESAGIDSRDWPGYEPLIPHLSDEESYLLRRFIGWQSEMSLSTPIPEHQLTSAVRGRLDHAALEMLFNARLWNALDRAYSYEEFIRQGEQLIRALSNEFSGSRFADSLADTTDDSGQLSQRARRHLERLWYSAHPKPEASQ